MFQLYSRKGHILLQQWHWLIYVICLPLMVGERERERETQKHSYLIPVHIYSIRTWINKWTTKQYDCLNIMFPFLLLKFPTCYVGIFIWIVVSQSKYVYWTIFNMTTYYDLLCDKLTRIWINSNLYLKLESVKPEIFFFHFNYWSFHTNQSYWVVITEIQDSDLSYVMILRLVRKRVII